MLRPMVSVFCLFVLLYPITAASSTNPPYIAVDDIKLDCGSDGNSKGLDGCEWTGDINSKFFALEEDNHKSNTSKMPEGRIIKAPYSTARISYSQFTYVFPVTPVPKFIRLYFYHASYSGFEMSMGFFIVKVGSLTLLKSFQDSILIFLGDLETYVKVFCINVEENQKLSLTFIPLSTSFGNYYAFINGIEIVSMPEHLYYSPQDQTQSEEEVPYNLRCLGQRSVDTRTSTNPNGTHNTTSTCTTIGARLCLG